MSKKRVVCLIDGFNLYHSLADLARLPQNTEKLKWLDIAGLINGFVHSSKEDLVGIYYFSALYQFNQRKKNRHQVYIKALKHTGIEVVLGRFKTKDMYCKNCRTSFQSHEEKRTDVNIALYLTHLAYRDVYDTALLVTGDTDLIPAIEMVKDSFPDKKIGVIFPYRRINDDLKDAADFNRKIEPRDVYKSIFPNRIEIENNIFIHCPSDWR